MGFEEDLRSGKFGEYAVKEAFNREAFIKQVADVREDKLFQSFDVDLLVEDTKLQWWWVEVKTDYQTERTGNIVYEVFTSNNPGCYEHTKAHIIAYYLPQNGHIYLIDVKRLREIAHTMKYELKQISSNTRGYLIPLSELERGRAILKMLKGQPQEDFSKKIKFS